MNKEPSKTTRNRNKPTGKFLKNIITPIEKTKNKKTGWKKISRNYSKDKKAHANNERVKILRVR